MHQVTGRVNILCNHLLEGVPGPFDLICANLPYIPSDVLRQLPVYLREPTLALDGGEDGLAVIRDLLKQAAQKLAPGGSILLEIGAGQPEKTKSLAAQFFPQAYIRTKLDLAGHQRLLIIETE